MYVRIATEQYHQQLQVSLLTPDTTMAECEYAWAY